VKVTKVTPLKLKVKLVSETIKFMFQGKVLTRKLKPRTGQQQGSVKI